VSSAEYTALLTLVAAALAAAGVVVVGPGTIGERTRDLRDAPRQIKRGKRNLRRGERDLARVKTLLPGTSGEATADLGKGKYDLVCILGNHEELGMYGTLVVR
jgi:hypothetical protein